VLKQLNYILLLFLVIIILCSTAIIYIWIYVNKKVLFSFIYLYLPTKGKQWEKKEMQKKQIIKCWNPLLTFQCQEIAQQRKKQAKYTVIVPTRKLPNNLKMEGKLKFLWVFILPWRGVICSVCESRPGWPGWCSSRWARVDLQNRFWPSAGAMTAQLQENLSRKLWLIHTNSP
jgi:hypothetical protein